MSKQAVEFLFQGATTELPAYDSTKTNLGYIVSQFNQGSNPENKFAGPMPVAIGRPMEASTAIPCMFPCAIDNGSGKQQVFFADNAAAAATRRVVLYEYDLTLGTFTWKGFTTITFPSATNFTIKGFRVVRYPYSTGTVGVSGTAVTGTGTAWKTYGVSAGARIGFGSTNPALITTWYEIAPGSALASDTAITLSTTAGTITAGTPYVIEDYRILIAATNATTTNGGLFVVKGMHPAAFTAVGTAVAAAVSTDNVRACFWLADASTVTNITAVGCDVEATISGDGLTHNAYVLDSTGAKVYKYNTRKALTLASGKDYTTMVLTTGAQAVTGTLGSANNGRCAVMSNGPGAGVECLYYVTTTRIYRSALTNITSGSTTWQNDSMTEVPTGGVATYVASGAMNTLEYMAGIDRLLVGTTQAAGLRSYVTQYRTDGGQMDHIFGLDDKQLGASTIDYNLPTSLVTQSQAQTYWETNGVVYAAGIGITAALNIITVIPLGAHWTYAATTNNRLITPAITLPGATKLYRVYTNEVEAVGAGEQNKAPEPYRTLARTSGITDNSGAWTLLGANGDLSGLASTGTIQIAYEFKCIGDFCIPARIMGLSVLYESGDFLDSRLQWSYDDSSEATGIIGFIQKTSMGGVPVFNINYFRNDTDVNILAQLSSTTQSNGVFEYWSGSAWVAGTGTDTVGLRRRFRPIIGLPSGVAIYAKLTTQ